MGRRGRMCVYSWTQLARHGGKPPQQLRVFPYALQLVGLLYMVGVLQSSERAWGWRVACVFAYGGASAVAAWGL